MLIDISDIVVWVGIKSREWTSHVDRIGEDKLAKISKECRPQGVISRGRPKKEGKRALMYTLSENRMDQRTLFEELGSGLLRRLRREEF